jgi:hypothetical protein
VTIATVLVGFYTMKTSDTLVEVAAGVSVTFPVVPTLNTDYVITPVSGTLESNPVQLSGNGYDITDPGAAMPYTVTATGTMKVSGQANRWRWDGTKMVLV